jgi:hypothetical protein
MVPIDDSPLQKPREQENVPVNIIYPAPSRVCKWPKVSWKGEITHLHPLLSIKRNKRGQMSFRWKRSDGVDHVNVVYKVNCQEEIVKGNNLQRGKRESMRSDWETYSRNKKYCLSLFQFFFTRLNQVNYQFLTYPQPKLCWKCLLARCSFNFTVIRFLYNRI